MATTTEKKLHHCHPLYNKLCYCVTAHIIQILYDKNCIAVSHLMIIHYLHNKLSQIQITCLTQISISLKAECETVMM